MSCRMQIGQHSRVVVKSGIFSNSSRDFFIEVPEYTHQMVVWIGSKCTGTFFVAFYVAMCKISVSLTQTRQVSWGAQALIEQDLARTDVTPDRIVVN